jgi:hypothetical protein
MALEWGVLTDRYHDEVRQSRSERCDHDTWVSIEYVDLLTLVVAGVGVAAADAAAVRPTRLGRSFILE